MTAAGLRRYKIIGLIGDGTYGYVYLACNVETQEKVAIKSMKRKYYSWDEVMSLKEVKSLKKLHHPNVVKLKEVIRENNRLYFIFEYIKGDLLGVMRQKDGPFEETWVKNVIHQVLQGLVYMHNLGFFHRDLKPENILTTGPDVVKIADFGLAREIRSNQPFTDYVSTRWYRAPEVLLRSTNYNSPIDMWAIGCITSELLTKRPLFPGTSEIDQLYKICNILGTPDKNDWTDGYVLATKINFRFPLIKDPIHLSQILECSSLAISFLYTVLTWNPSRRQSAAEALKHPFFKDVKAPVKAIDTPDSQKSNASIVTNSPLIDQVHGSSIGLPKANSIHKRPQNHKTEIEEKECNHSLSTVKEPLNNDSSLSLSRDLLSAFTIKTLRKSPSKVQETLKLNNFDLAENGKSSEKLPRRFTIYPKSNPENSSPSLALEGGRIYSSSFFDKPSTIRKNPVKVEEEKPLVKKYFGFMNGNFGFMNGMKNASVIGTRHPLPDSDSNSTRNVKKQIRTNWAEKYLK